MNKKRLDWVDIAKGVAILAVVLLHTDYTFPASTLKPITAIIGDGWHVAVFFLIGGFFLKEEKLCKPVSFIKGKVRSLYLLASYFYVPAVLLHNVLFAWGWYDTTVSYGGKYLTEFTPPQLLKALVETLCCAGREPVLGAVWFVYVLFLAMCLLSMMSWGMRKIIKNEEVYQRVYPLTLLAFCIIMCTLTRDVEFNIPRFNNTFTAMWLIYVGYWLRNKARWTFENKWMFIGSLMVFIHYCMTYPKGMALNANHYSDVISLTIGTVSALYVICYLSVKIQGSVIGKILRKCGEESFNIMALQFVGFKIGCYALNAVGFNLPLAQLLAPTENRLYLVLWFVFVGAAFPIAFMWCFRNMKASILKIRSKQ